MTADLLQKPDDGTVKSGGGTSEQVFTSASARAQATAWRLLVGLLVGLAAAAAAIPFLWEGHILTDHLLLFFGTGAAGALLGLFVPMRWDTLRIGSASIVLSRGNQTRDIPTADIRLIMAKTTILNYTRPAIHFRTTYFAHSVHLYENQVEPALQALIEACPDAVVLIKNLGFVLPRSKKHTLSEAEVSDVTSGLNGEIWRGYLRAGVLFLAAGIFLVLLGISVAHAGFQNIKATLHLVVAVLTLLIAGVGFVFNAKGIQQAKRRFLDAVEPGRQ